jgi:hypothetical protein
VYFNPNQVYTFAGLDTRSGFSAGGGFSARGALQAYYNSPGYITLLDGNNPYMLQTIPDVIRSVHDSDLYGDVYGANIGLEEINRDALEVILQRKYLEIFSKNIDEIEIIKIE